MRPVIEQACGFCPSLDRFLVGRAVLSYVGALNPYDEGNVALARAAWEKKTPIQRRICKEIGMWVIPETKLVYEEDPGRITGGSIQRSHDPMAYRQLTVRFDAQIILRVLR